ncbi:MAG: hypothetical protein GY788_27220 [bacterium]|nr:hypothetical protein [bacterium]
MTRADIRSLVATMQVLAVARGDQATDHGSVYDTLLAQPQTESAGATTIRHRSRPCRIEPAGGWASRLPHSRAAALMRRRGQYV